MSGTPIVVSRRAGSDRFANPVRYLRRLSVHKLPNRERTPLSTIAAALLLSACGSPESHSEASMNPWPSLTAAPARFITSDHLDLWPCFSPDGTQVLFSRRAGEGWEFLLVSINGGPAQKLTATPLPVAATRANWSKQNQIAFTGTSSGGASAVWVMGADGSSARELNLTGLSNQVFYPSWFPDGERLAAMDAKDRAIKRIDIPTGSVVTLTDHEKVLAGMPSVSPDGKSIIFAGQKNAGQNYDQSNNELWLADESGGLAPPRIQLGSRPSSHLVAERQTNCFRIDSRQRQRIVCRVSHQS